MLTSVTQESLVRLSQAFCVTSDRTPMRSNQERHGIRVPHVAWSYSGKRGLYHGVTSLSGPRMVPCSNGAVAGHAIGDSTGVTLLLCHGSGSGQIDLALDLLASPTSSVNSARAEVAVLAGVANKGSNPIVTEESCKLAVGESLSQVTAKVSQAPFGIL